MTRARLCALGAVMLLCTAHVGSPDAWYEGPAGPYRVLVHVQLPGVVPGIARIGVYAPDVDRVTAVVNTFDAQGGAPPPDVAVHDASSPGWYRAKLWVMAAGSNGVTVTVNGSRGSGSVVVPITALAGRRLGFSAPMVSLGVTCALILAAGFLSILRAAKREGVLTPGATPDADDERAARRMLLRGGVILVTVVTLMSLWWRSVDASFRDTLFTSLQSHARVDTTGGARRLVLTIDDSLWTKRDRRPARGQLQIGDLVVDHGKLMHLFVVSRSGTSLAHLHPLTNDSTSFTASLPPLPAGMYDVYADVVHASGLSETLTSTVVLPAPSAAQRSPSDADDSWSAAAASNGDGVGLDDGTTLSWVNRPQTIAANEAASLRFAINRTSGDTALLQTYLGMAGHAVVVRRDGSVFIHLHPLGTISLAAQERVSGSSLTMSHTGHATDTLHFPYAFPEPGSYTVWVQVKRRDRVMTGAFAVEVVAAAATR